MIKVGKTEKLQVIKPSGPGVICDDTWGFERVDGPLRIDKEEEVAAILAAEGNALPPSPEVCVD